MKTNTTQNKRWLIPWRLLTLFAVLMVFCTFARAQVTVGAGTQPQKYSILEVVSNGNGGLRLPQLSTGERNTITDAAFKADPLSEGLAIFNTTTKCYEYWNSTRWVSLCKGDANISFEDDGGNPADPFATVFPCGGETRGAFIPHDSPDCTSMAVPYDFMVMIGNEYTSFNVLNASTGEFELTMNPNPTARERRAVLRVTNNCTGEYKEFLFAQEGCAGVCQPLFAKPVISVSNSGVACATGAVYMYITIPEAGANYVWTLNDSEISEYRGKAYCVATQSGAYRVYVGGIGCDTNASDKTNITVNASTAPAAVREITASNNGVICSTANVLLTAYHIPATGTLTWYKNGQKTTKTGNPASLAAGDEGDWFAVVEEGSCTSKPSNTITVTLDNTSTPITAPEITVNGVDISLATFCAGGYITLDISNMASYTNAVTVSWYNGTSLLGTGTPFSFTAPASGTFLLRCIVHDNTSAYCDAEEIYTKTVSGTAPARPAISGNPVICGGSPALLTATGGGASYKWFKDNAEIPGATTDNYSATTAGQYQVQVTDGGGCISPLSAIADVKISAFPSIAFTLPQAQVEPLSVVTYQVVASQSPHQYIWTVSSPGGNVVLLDGSSPNTLSSTTTTNSMRVQMGSDIETITLSCVAVNDCGNSPKAVQSINVQDACTPVGIGNITMPSQGSVLAGKSVSMSVTATGSAPFTYQWKFKAAGSDSWADIAGAEAATYSFIANTTHSGTYMAIVNNCGDTPVGGVAGTINVINMGGVPDGSGKLAGKDCFDVNQSEGAGCGTASQRQTANFAQAYTYTFTNSGTGNSDLTWVIDENPAGAIIDYGASIIQNVPGALGNGQQYTISIKYKQSLMTDAIGTTDATAFKVNIYAVYTTGGVSNKAQLAVKIKDCRCACGANTISGTWLTFMCHNLGADETQDPFTYTNAIVGDLYQWGRPKDGHQLRTSPITSVLATSDDATTPEAVIGKFIKVTGGADWRSGGGSIARWGNGTMDASPPKAANDPCPTGWKVPSQVQWESIIKLGGGAQVGSSSGMANTWTWTGSGFKVGEALYLPAAGRRTMGDGNILYLGSYGYYWTSSIFAGAQNTAYRLEILYSGSISVTHNEHLSFGMSVRCVQE